MQAAEERRETIEALQRENISLNAMAVRLNADKARQTAELILGQLFAWLKTNIGVEDAWRNFNDWTERARPHSLAGHRGPSDHRHNSYLLGVYDQLAEESNGEGGALPRFIGEKVHRDTPGKYGNSVDAIAKRIRRLLAERKARRAIDAQFRADLQELIDEWGRDTQKKSANKRRRNASTKSRDK